MIISLTRTRKGLLRFVLSLWYTVRNMFAMQIVKFSFDKVSLEKSLNLHTVRNVKSCSNQTGTLIITQTNGRMFWKLAHCMLRFDFGFFICWCKSTGLDSWQVISTASWPDLYEMFLKSSKWENVLPTCVWQGQTFSFENQ